ncbi:MAG: hypothetical protein GXP17_04380 [Gammaproteobacteria bacterium]|nr:hypothetical protein [Gammaproteobacteria bacterium]
MTKPSVTRANRSSPGKKGGVDEKGSALPKAWLVPIRLAIYSVLAASSAYVYFNVGELGLTHYLVIISIIAVAAMALLDCRMSEEYWRKQEKLAENSKTEDRSKDGAE